MRIRSVVPLALSMIVAGCSIHPLPKDVTRETSRSIAKKIRCESFFALKEQLINFLSSPKNPLSTRAVAEKMESGELKLKDLERSHLDLKSVAMIDTFSQTVIGYTFRFLITENNNKSGNATFTMPFTGGTFTLGIGAGANKQRKNSRTFKIVESFEEMKDLECSDIHVSRAHWIYPITGKIGMAEVINTFIELVSDGGTLSAFADTLTFTTKFFSTVDPKVVLDNPASKKFKLTEGKIALADDREDIHEVIVSLDHPDKGKGAKKAGAARTMSRKSAIAITKQNVSNQLDRVQALDIQREIIQELPGR